MKTVRHLRVLKKMESKYSQKDMFFENIGIRFF